MVKNTKRNTRKESPDSVGNSVVEAFPSNVAVLHDVFHLLCSVCQVNVRKEKAHLASTETRICMASSFRKA